MRPRLRLKRLLMVVTVMLMCCTPARSQQLQAALLAPADVGVVDGALWQGVRLEDAGLLDVVATGRKKRGKKQDGEPASCLN